MDDKTFGITVRELIEEIRPIAQSNPEATLDKARFEKILDIAKQRFYDNDLIREMDSGPLTNHIEAFAYLERLSIIKSAIDAIEEEEEGEAKWEEPEE